MHESLLCIIYSLQDFSTIKSMCVNNISAIVNDRSRPKQDYTRDGAESIALYDSDLRMRKLSVLAGRGQALFWRYIQALEK